MTFSHELKVIVLNVLSTPALSADHTQNPLPLLGNRRGLLRVKTRIQSEEAKETIINTQTLLRAVQMEPPGSVATLNPCILAIRKMCESKALLCNLVMAVTTITVGCSAESQGA